MRRPTTFSILAATLFVTIAGCTKPPAPPAPPPAAVDVAKPVVQTIIEWDEYTGRLAAIESVDVRARVGGYLDSIHFKDGQTVAKGDLLMVIDPRPYTAALAEAKGDYDQAISRLELAQSDLDRVSALLGTKAISQEDYDTRAKTVKGAEAAVKGSQARIDTAKLNLSFTEVRSPMAGRTTRHQASIGNLISGGTADSTVLTNIVTVDPIYCYFDVSEQAYLKYIRLDKNGTRISSRTAANPVQVSLMDENDFKHPGRMDFVDNQLDALTGTLRGRAILDNQSLGLLPGTFVKLRLPGSGQYQAVMIPDRAIVADQSDRFVFVVDAENKVQQRRIVPGRTYEGLRLITSGLDGSESVIIDGIQRVRPGAVVSPEVKTLPAPPQDLTAMKPALAPTTAPATTQADVAKGGA